MLDKTNLIALAKAAASANASAPTAYSFNGKNLSYEALNETLRNEFSELASDYSSYRENKNTIFSIIETVIDDLLPKKVVEQYDSFAEVRVFKQGDKPAFRRKRNPGVRAKQFITRVGLAGRYEVFKLALGEEVFEVRTSAIGGAAQVSIEEFLDGRVDFAELTRIVMEGMQELISREITASFQASINQLPLANRVAVAGFDEQAMDKLIEVARAYGVPTIYCTHEFAVRMIPQEAWRYTEAMKDQLYKTGRLPDYKGTRVIELEQGFEDETNSRKVIDPGYAWVIPAGADSKPVKVAFEGQTLIKESELNNDDWSKEFHVYRKVGIVTMLANSICSYIDTELLGQKDTWFFGATVKNTVTIDGIVKTESV